jgi:zinc/manganese transport system substrate-binding protein
VVLNVGKLVGVAAGGNPHLWYSRSDVRRVIGTLTADYRKLGVHTSSIDLGTYDQEVALIRSRYAGAKVGASESIFAPLAQALGLDLITPASFLKAISEGTDPTANDLATIGRQIAQRSIKVWVYNSQNSTPDVQRLTSAARAKHIPVVTITETLSPAGASFQAWQVAQLRRLAAALAR